VSNIFTTDWSFVYNPVIEPNEVEQYLLEQMTAQAAATEAQLQLL
jgi:hypothetical protein